MFHENIDNYKIVIDFIYSISFDSKNLHDKGRIIDLGESNYKRAIDFLIQLKDSLFSNLHDSKKIIDIVNFPETWIIVYIFNI